MMHLNQLDTFGGKLIFSSVWDLTLNPSQRNPGYQETDVAIHLLSGSCSHVTRS